MSCGYIHAAFYRLFAYYGKCRRLASVVYINLISRLVFPAYHKFGKAVSLCHIDRRFYRLTLGLRLIEKSLVALTVSVRLRKHSLI